MMIIRALAENPPEGVKKLNRTSLTDYGFESTAENLVERVLLRTLLAGKSRSSGGCRDGFGKTGRTTHS
jgi:hypothetical protein